MLCSRLHCAAPFGFAIATPAWLRLKSGCSPSRAPLAGVGGFVEVEAKRTHSQACKECKAATYKLLADAFGPGEVVQQYRLRLPSTLQGYEEHPYFSALQAIESELQADRGFTRFV